MRTPPEERRAIARAAAERSTRMINEIVWDIAQDIQNECEENHSIFAHFDDTLGFDFWRAYMLARVAWRQWVKDQSMDFPHTPSEIAAHTDAEEVVTWLAHHPGLNSFLEEMEEEIEHLSTIAASRVSKHLTQSMRPMTDAEVRRRRQSYIEMGRLPPEIEMPDPPEQRSIWELLDTNS